MAKSVEKVYGQALFDAAVEKSKVDDLYDGAISLKDILVKEKDLLTMLNNPRITEEEKNDIIDKVFADKLDGELIGLIKLMVKNNRQKNMIGVLDFFISKVKELKKIGLPKKEYFIWYDDSEFCLRINGGIALVPKAKLNHKTVLSYETGNIISRITWKHYYGYRNRYDCAKRHLGPATCIMILAEYSIFYIGSLIMYLNCNKRTQAKYNIKMLTQVMKDCLTGRLGKNPDYLP